MTVFKGFLTITKRNINILILYTVIFLAVSFAMQKLNQNNGSASFEPERLKITVIDKDKGALAKGLAKYLGQYHDLVDFPDDKDVLQEKLFYRDTFYILTIPEDFERKCLTGSEKLAVTKVPGSNSGFYVDQLINTFMNDARILTASGFTISESMDEIMAHGSGQSDVKLLDKNGHGGNIPSYAFAFQYAPYMILAILCYSLGNIIMAFRKADIKRRMLCSALSSRSQNAQMILGYLVVGIGVWLLCLLVTILMYGKALLADPNLPGYILNMFTLMLTTLSMAFLIGLLVHNDAALNGIVNVVALGMCFTCGVFVPLDILGGSLKTVVHFLPVYWYEVNNQLLAGNAAFSSAQLSNLYAGYGVQLLFAAAILGISLVISRVKEQA